MDQAQQLRNVIKIKNQNSISNARVITITSGKGGVGKSNVAVNLAVQLHKAGKRVVIFDADFGLANVEVMFGSVPKYNLSDVIYQGKNIREIITTGPMDIGFISGGSGVISLNNLYHEQIMYLINALGELNEIADFIIIDTGAGISDQVLQFVLASPEVLLVTTPEPSSLTDSYSLLKAMYRNPNFRAEDTAIRILANKTNSREEGMAVYNKLNSVVKQFLQGELEFFGMIPQDAALEKAVRQQKIVSMYDSAARSTKAFEQLTSRLLNGEQVDAPAKWGITQLFASLFRKS